MFIFDSILYMLLTIYIEAVCPGEYGIPLVWYFPLTKSYWFGQNNRYNSNELKDNESKIINEHFEEDTCKGDVGIKIVNLTKSFDQNTFVVKGVNLKAYSGQITALLGHNGAGNHINLVSFIESYFQAKQPLYQC